MSVLRRPGARSTVTATTALAVAVTLVSAGAATAGRTPGTAPGLPTVASGHRPGPDALYLPPATGLPVDVPAAGVLLVLAAGIGWSVRRRNQNPHG